MMVVLIEFRSTHNFLDTTTLKKTRLCSDTKEAERVRVANEAIMDSEEKVSNIAFSIQK